MKFITQKRVRGVQRRRFQTAVDEAIEKAVLKECARYNVARSFVIRNALAFTFGIDVEPYIDVKIKKRNKV